MNRTRKIFWIVLTIVVLALIGFMVFYFHKINRVSPTESITKKPIYYSPEQIQKMMSQSDPNASTTIISQEKIEKEMSKPDPTRKPVIYSQAQIQEMMSRPNQ